MGRKALFYVIETQQYITPSGLEDYLELYPSHTMIEVIADESVLSTPGSRLPAVKSYLRETQGSELKTVTYSGSGVFINTIGGINRSVANKRDITANYTTNSNTYVVASSFSYTGSSNEGVPIQITAIVNVTTSSNNTGLIRLYDSTNNVVLGEATVTQPGKRAVDLQGLDSFPTTNAVLEIQISNTGSSPSRSMTFYTLTMIY